MGFNDQLIFPWHDQHENLTRTDDSADRVNGQLVNKAVPWRPNIDTAQFVFRGNFLFFQLRDAGTYFLQFFQNLRAVGFLDLERLDFPFAYGFPAFRNLRQEITVFALQPRPFAFKRDDAALGNKLLLQKATQVGKLQSDEIDFPFLGGDLGGEPFDLLIELPYLFLKLLLPADHACSARFKKQLLSTADILDIRHLQICNLFEFYCFPTRHVRPPNGSPGRQVRRVA